MFGYKFGLKHNLSSAERWKNREGQHDIGGHVEDVYDASTIEVEEYLPLVEFSYNNGYQESLRMSFF